MSKRCYNCRTFNYRETLNPLAAEEFFFIFFFENLIKNTYYWLDQGKKVKNAKKKFKGVFLGILRVAL